MHLLSVASLANRALVALVTICVAIFGGVALTSLRTELVPDITLPQVVVSSQYPGVSAEIVDADVTGPIEDALQVVPGLETTTGTSTTGASTVVASFTYGTNLPTTEQRVQQAVNRIASQLPDGITPTVLTGSIADLPILQIAVPRGDDEAALVDRIEQVVIPALERVDGVRGADLAGAEGQRVTIAPDDAALASAGLTRQAIGDAIDANGVLLPGGTVTEGDQTLSVQIGGTLASVDELSAIPVGPGLTIADVATVTLDADPASSVSIVNGEQSISISVTKLQSANTVEVSNLVQALLPELEGDLGGVEMTVVFDQAPFIEQSIDALATEGLLGLAFAVLVILVFLLSVRATLVTAISIPTSVLITFIGLWASGYTMNILTLGALTIAIGRVVDDSIVVIENIKRHLAFAPTRMRAILDGVREVAGAITASTVTTVIVFLPLAFVTDVTGELFRPFSLTVTIALLASLLVALTIVPVLAYWVLRAPKGSPAALARVGADARVAKGADDEVASEEPNAQPEPVAASRDYEEAPGRLRRGFRPILAWTLRHPVLVLVGAVLVLGGSAAAVPLMAVNFLGDTGQTSVRATQTLEPGASLETRLDAATATSAALEDVEGVDIVQATVSQGAGAFAGFGFGGGGTSEVSYSITAEDGADMPALIERMRDALADQPGETSVAEAGGGFGGSDVTVDVTAPTEDELVTATEAVHDAVADLDGVAATSDSLEAAQPIVQVTIDREAAADAGLSEVAVAALVAQAMQPQPVGDIQLDGSVVRIYLAPTGDVSTIDELRQVPVPTALGAVPLDDLADVEDSLGPVSIATLDGERTATVTVTPSTADVRAVGAAVQEAVDGVELADGAAATVGGASADITEAFTQLGIAALIAILLVYVVMVATFKSLLQPLLLLVSVPFAATGAILLQVVTGLPLGVASMVGVLMLVGIVVTNAIVLVDLVNQYRDRGMSVRDALAEGAERRMRPVLMTAAATVFALVPMALGITGHGGFISQPLAIVVIGGLVSSTLLTLVVLPALYLLVEGSIERSRVRRGRGTRAQVRSELRSSTG
ncbi:efflux RND transporter permease subunit [Agrococcus jejuensis]|uniref:Hydrophobic/amphiphilic exporter-1, HAE1 family n=1 Tax=Agrococcus jejuensis TaxID=399736 RepID=A0A1G8EJN3_9MICO|nr:efflux RND transporter permease subunit [Agrococcus jejuensis]SDH70145.1 hydrophobic/amphiphilic exporter-1, HAE1 family [Agrococcus jejuensis]